MKSDHRHELKTNELAEWLSNLPLWARENRITIICVSVLIIGVATFYIWRSYSQGVVARKQLELTETIGRLLDGKRQILQAQAQGRDLSFILLQPADNLRIFAQNTGDDQMAAFALIEQAEALRTELHYRQGKVPAQEAAAQFKQAKTSYAQALERCSANPSLTAMAKFGLGLCEEELGNFEVAEQIYRDVSENSDFEGTVAAAQAEMRLEAMDDYKQRITFRPAPKKVPARPAVGPVDLGFLPIEADLSANVNLPLDFDVGTATPNTSSDRDNLDDVISLDE